jgi:hypothetical protein
LKGLQHPAVTAFGATAIIVLTLLALLVSPLHHEEECSSRKHMVRHTTAREKRRADRRICEFLIPQPPLPLRRIPPFHQDWLPT